MGMGKHIGSETRALILKVLTFFENEKANGRLIMPVDQAIKRACAATVVCKRTLFNIKCELRNGARRQAIGSSDDSVVLCADRNMETASYATSASRPGTSAQNAAKKSHASSSSLKAESSPNQVLVFCPKCDEAVPHTVQGIQQDQTRIFVTRVYHYFEQEYDQLKKLYGSVDLSPLAKFRQRTALATGVSESTVLRILEEEEEAKRRKDSVRQGQKRARERSSDGESDSDDDDDPDEPSNSAKKPRAPVETLVVKVEPPEYHVEPEIYVDRLQVKEEPKDSEYIEVEAAVASLQVKSEPPEDTQDTANKTSNIVRIVRQGKKKPQKRDDISTTTTQQHTQGEPSTAEASSSVPTEELDESGPLGDGTLIVDKFEVHEEGFS